MPRSKILMMVALILIAPGCWAGWAPFVTSGAGQTTRGLPATVDPALVQAAEALPELAGWTLVPLSQFVRGERTVLIAWPAFNPEGRVAQGSVTAIAFTRVGQGPYRPEGERWPVRGASTPADLGRTLGGSDYQMLPRNEGVPLSQLGPQLAARCQAFAEAAQGGDRAAAVGHAIEFTRLLSVDQVAYESSAAHLLSLCSDGYDLRHLTTQRRSDSAATVQLMLQRGSSSRRQVLGDAELAREQTDHWVLTSLQWPSES